MSETRHTPGPWTVDSRPWFETLQNGKVKEHWRVRGLNGEAPTNIATCMSNAIAIDNEANACLIAAAPDLLAALSDIEGLLCEVAPEYAESPMAANARAAIAKAVFP